MPRYLLSGLITLLSLFIASAALAAPSTHEIIQKLSAENYVTSNISHFSVSLPKTWTSKKLSDAVTVFQVPYHAGVIGHIEFLDAKRSTENAVSIIQDAFKANFQIESNTQRTDFEGLESTLSGRLGGEIWKALVFTGTTKSGKLVFFYAVAPSNWFNTYKPFFEDILTSLE